MANPGRTDLDRPPSVKLEPLALLVRRDHAPRLGKRREISPSAGAAVGAQLGRGTASPGKTLV